MPANVINSGPPPLKKAKTDGSTPSILAFFGKKAPVAPATESELSSLASRAHKAAEAVSLTELESPACQRLDAALAPTKAAIHGIVGPRRAPGNIKLHNINCFG